LRRPVTNSVLEAYRLMCIARSAYAQAVVHYDHLCLLYHRQVRYDWDEARDAERDRARDDVEIKERAFLRARQAHRTAFDKYEGTS
jgi:hypothetical protein